MAYRRLEITYTNPTAVYAPGQTVEGAVTLETDQKLSVRGIRLQFKGKTLVKWTEYNGQSSVTYVNREEYFSHEEILFGKHPNQGREITDLPAGIHTYRFSFTLPPKLPNSFQGGKGGVRYRTMVILDRLLRRDDKVKKPFTIVNTHSLDLNRQPDAMTQVRKSKQKNFCCLCCKSAPLSATAHIPRKGYVSGDTVIVNAEIDNGTRRNITQSYFVLKMVASFTGQACGCSKTVKETKEVIRTAAHPGISPRGSDYWNGERLVIPPGLPPSFLEGSRYIDVQYYVQLTVDPAGMALDLDVPLNIILGDVPHHQVADQQGFGGGFLTS